MTSAQLVPSSPEAVLRAALDSGLIVDASTLRRDESGSDFVVYHCSDLSGRKWILRFPRRVEVAERVPAERQLLDLVRDYIRIPVPDWQVADERLVAYPKLSGRLAAAEDPQTGLLTWAIDQSNPPEAYIDALAATMAALHRVPTVSVAAIGIPVRTPDDVKRSFADRLERGRHELKMHESWLDRGRRWLECDAWWPQNTVLIHGDLHPGHTLVDDIGHITGLLDWSDAEIGDPGAEFIECSRKFPVGTVDRLIRAYERHGGHLWAGLRENVREGIAFAPLTLGLMGLDTAQQRYIDRGNAALSVPTKVVAV